MTTSAETPRIILFPGMGADERMYTGPWLTLPNIYRIRWPRGRFSTLEELAKKLIDDGTVRDGDILIGSSLGGMVACACAQIIDAKHIILLGSATHPQEVSPILRWLHPLLYRLPLRVFQFIASFIPHDLCRMFADADATFMKDMCLAIFQWQGYQGDTPIYRIHGNGDPVIPMPPNAHAELYARHAIAMSHAAECVALIATLGLHPSNAFTTPTAF